MNLEREQREKLEVQNILDIEFDEKFKITNFTSNTQQAIQPNQIMTISKHIVVGELKINYFKAKNTKNTDIYLENLSVNVMKMQDYSTTKKLMPSKITVNSDILIGKKLSKDIIGKNNELILKQNQILAAKQVMPANQHDKLNELFYSVY